MSERDIRLHRDTGTPLRGVSRNVPVQQACRDTKCPVMSRMSRLNVPLC